MSIIMDEKFEDDTERERQWLKKEFGENNEFFIALQGKLKKKDNFLDDWEKKKSNFVKYNHLFYRI